MCVSSTTAKSFSSLALLLWSTVPKIKICSLPSFSLFLFLSPFSFHSLSPVSHLLSPSPDTPYISIEEPCQMLLNFVLRNMLTLRWQFQNITKCCQFMCSCACDSSWKLCSCRADSHHSDRYRRYRSQFYQNLLCQSRKQLEFSQLDNRGEKRKCICPDWRGCCCSLLCCETGKVEEDKR